jgi:hypothetical protein
MDSFSTEPPAPFRTDTVKPVKGVPRFQPSSSNVEKCEITYENTGMSIRRFVAKATGPNGPYEAARSRNLTGEALFDLLDTMAGEVNEGPSSLVQTNMEIHRELVERLVQAGWEQTKEQGEHWWSKRFIRRVHTSNPLSLPDAPQIWEPWFHSRFNNRTFERKLMHMMGFDGMIHLFEIRTNDATLDILLNGQLFLDFCAEIKDGVFLRQIRTPEDWPQTTLVLLNVLKGKLAEVVRSDSSFVDWSVHNQTDTELTLITERRATSSKGYRIRYADGISLEPFTSP